MKFISPLSNLRLLYNFFLFLALINIFFSTGKSHAKTFSINDIEISTPFEINFNKNEIIDEGFVKAFNELILSIAQSKHVKVLFMGSNTVKTPLHLATSLAGVLHRSKEGDSVMVGRKEYPFEEVLDFTTKNWRSSLHSFKI